MVCGQVFIEHPELVLLVGADISATDARQGSVQAQNLVGLLASPNNPTTTRTITEG
jgi:hypothetical protein